MNDPVAADRLPDPAAARRCPGPNGKGCDCLENGADPLCEFWPAPDLPVAASDHGAAEVVPWRDHDFVVLRRDSDPSTFLQDEHGYHARNCRGCRIDALLVERQQAQAEIAYKQGLLDDLQAARQQAEERIARALWFLRWPKAVPQWGVDDYREAVRLARAVLAGEEDAG